VIVFTIASGHRAISGAQASSPAASERFSPVSASAAPWRLHEHGGGLALEDLIVGGRGSVASQVRTRADRDNVQGQAASTAATCAPAACSRPSRARWRSSREEGCENGASSWASSRRLLRGASERKRAVDANSHTPARTPSRSGWELGRALPSGHGQGASSVSPEAQPHGGADGQSLWCSRLLACSSRVLAATRDQRKDLDERLARDARYVYNFSWNQPLQA